MMSERLNPFEAPPAVGSLATETAEVESDPRPFVRRYRFILWCLCYAAPVYVLASFYFAWLVAWYQLGHAPRPMLDDPKSVGGVATIVYLASGLVVMFSPGLMLMGLGASFFYPRAMTTGKKAGLSALLLVLNVLLSATVIFLVRWDPMNVVEWWFD